jgi:esterase
MSGIDVSVPLGNWDANVVRWPSDAARQVLLLHGFTAHAASWRHLADSLGPSFDVAALDQRGHGRSHPTERHGSRPMVADIELLLDALGWDRADLVGQSMGGVNAFVFAAHHPSRVRRLVVVDVGPEVAAAGIARIRANVGARPDVFDDLASAVAEGRVLFPRADAQLLHERIEANLVETGDGRLTWRTAVGLRQGTTPREDHSTADKWTAWSALTAPTLLVHGVESDILTDDLVARMVDARPATQVVHIPGAGHSVPLDRPIELAAAVHAFLADN